MPSAATNTGLVTDSGLPKILGEHHATRCPQGECGHKRILELLAAKLDLLPFIKGERIGSIHFQTDNEKALSYLVKMEATGCSTLVRMSKENWGISMFKDISYSRVLAKCSESAVE